MDSIPWSSRNHCGHFLSEDRVFYFFIPLPNHWHHDWHCQCKNQKHHISFKDLEVKEQKKEKGIKKCDKIWGVDWSWPKTNFEVKQLEALEKLKHMVKEFLVEVLEDIENTFKFEQSMRETKCWKVGG